MDDDSFARPLDSEELASVELSVDALPVDVDSPVLEVDSPVLEVDSPVLEVDSSVLVLSVAPLLDVSTLAFVELVSGSIEVDPSDDDSLLAFVSTGASSPQPSITNANTTQPCLPSILSA